MKASDESLNLEYLLEGMVDTGRYSNVRVSDIQIDSRKIRTNELFVALQGSRLDGSKFIDDAINKGASAILVEMDKVSVTADYPVPVIPVRNLNDRLGEIARRFFNDPSSAMQVTGITGTNGKTSTAYYLAQAMTSHDGKDAAYIGTLGYGTVNQLEAGINTTPDVLTLNHLLDGFRNRKIDRVAMEVSSHGLEQGRVNGINFKTAVFTNLSRDHLDYHSDMSAYAKSKKRLFKMPGLENVIINIDDKFGIKLADELQGSINVIRYGIKHDSGNGDIHPDISASILQQKMNSLEMSVFSPWGNGRLSLSLAGRFNAYNMLACLGGLSVTGVPFEDAIEHLSRVRGVPGRLEYFNKHGSPNIFVDYAHTPDALEQALNAIKPYCQGKLICVFGCGGDRDPGKRSQMGTVAEKYADHVILTNDNPRSESPEKIVSDIRSGMSQNSDVEIMYDRSTAIQDVIKSASVNDCILIAGKGHETYQEIGATRHPFSDRQQVRNILGLGE